MVKRLISIYVLILAIGMQVQAQLSSLGYNPEVSHLLDRLETNGSGSFDHLSVRYLSLSEIIANQPEVESLSKMDRYSWEHLMNNIPEAHRYDTSLVQPKVERKGIFKTFYKNSTNFYVLDTDDFFLKIDPLIHFALGDDTQDDDFIFQNTRGIKLRGTIDDKVYFHTEILENQQRFLSFEESEINRINAIPGQGFYKPYQSGIVDNVQGWDFLNSSAYVGLKISKSIDLQLGHGRHFIGDGIRSMLLSDYANNYFYLQFNTRIWKLHYQNTFAELSAISSKDNVGNELLPKKYLASHYLDFKVSRRLTFGLYEAVVFSRQNNFEFQYLNPIILYRSVEQFLDSPDNALLGLNVKWVPKDKYQVYGQLMIDELRTSEAFSGSGWWGNKTGVQLGLKKFDLFNVANLDAQIEYNTARPYTYTHRDQQASDIPLTSYAHFNQALAHPFGANFTESLISVKYRPSTKLFVSLLFQKANYGSSSVDNVGRNILANYEDRASDFGNTTGQGIPNDITSFNFQTSYEVFPNYYIDFTVVNRSQKIDGQQKIRTNYFGFGFRANVFSRPSLL